MSATRVQHYDIDDLERIKILHSPPALIVVFHAQLLADFNTVDELAWKMLEELDRK